MTKKIIAFDLDDTLAVTKSPISDVMGELLVRLLQHYDICIISGGKFEQFKTQVIDRLEASERELSRLHLMPTCGTRYLRYDEIEHSWVQQYAEDLTDDEKQRAIDALTKSAKTLGFWEEQPYGDIIEDRGSQITFSAIGQQAPAEAKYAWDPTGEKKQTLRAAVAEQLIDLEVRAGGSTSIDITRIGIDKAYGMRKLMDAVHCSKEDILFIGDKLEEGGNDYPVKAFGIDTIAVDRWEDTAFVLRGITSVAS
ncbi:MAG: family hydrolase [Candidatus Saccharibacteria bacterium]|nr:family hydrolase [Candidatus Saccharibacteria bacterium]